MLTASLVGSGVLFVVGLVILWRWEVAKHERDKALSDLSVARASIAALSDQVSRLGKDLSSLQALRALEVGRVLNAVPDAALPSLLGVLLGKPVDPSTGLPVTPSPSPNPG